MTKIPALGFIFVALASASCSKNDNATRLTDPQDPPTVNDGPSDGVTNTDTSTDTSPVTNTGTDSGTGSGSGSGSGTGSGPGTGTNTVASKPGVFNLTAPADTHPSSNVTVSWTASSDAANMTVSLGAAPGCDTPTKEETVVATLGKVTLTGVAAGSYRVCAKATNTAGDTKAIEQTLVVGDVAVGRETLATAAPATVATTQALVGSVASAMIVGEKLIVADDSNSRVLIWNHVPHVDGQPADLVLGQANFTSGGANRGGAAAADTMNYPSGVYSDGTRLLVADGSNNRVLIWNTFPTTDGQPADHVIGQATMTDTSAAATPTGATLNYPYQLAVIEGKLLVSDYYNNRILIFASIPTTDGASAVNVIGQPDLTAHAAAAGTTGLNLPGQAAWDGLHLWVSDYENNRVLRYTGLPTTDGAAADLVLGQPDFTNVTSGISQATMHEPWGITVANDKLFVSDYTNNRVLVWDSLPTASSDSPDHVFGQVDFDHKDVVNPPTASTLYQPYETRVADGTMVIADYANARVILRPFP